MPAVRFGPRGAATVATVLSLICGERDDRLHGLFLEASTGMRELALQAFVLVVTEAPLMLGTLIGERSEAVAAWKRSDLSLRAFQEVLPGLHLSPERGRGLSRRLQSAGTSHLSATGPDPGPPARGGAARPRSRVPPPTSAALAGEYPSHWSTR